ncbi:hypothetical protein AK812_SmicGene30499 [Symbiodinium microadriaticum]|uniref:Uncharacterized protein n=1 Tax=Symbiodinium microadriaticum TaxID=2951 RepID=A0A1Q9CZ31_SYMMI|nr:hypothetical protein AK812_SmicGene30499 [Symbiodinium microadriaticum]
MAFYQLAQFLVAFAAVMDNRGDRRPLLGSSIVAGLIGQGEDYTVLSQFSIGGRDHERVRSGVGALAASAQPALQEIEGTSEPELSQTLTSEDRALDKAEMQLFNILLALREVMGALGVVRWKTSE